MDFPTISLFVFQQKTFRAALETKKTIQWNSLSPLLKLRLRNYKNSFMFKGNKKILNVMRNGGW